MEALRKISKFLGNIVLLAAVIFGVFWLKEKKNILLNPRQFTQNTQEDVAAKMPLPEKSNPKTVDFQWTYNRKKYAISETLYGSIYDFYKNKPKEFEYQGDLPADWKEKYFAMFLRVAPGDDTIAQIAADIKAAGAKNNLNNDQLAELVLAFVQAIPYDEAKAKLILAGDTHGLVSYPYETLYDNKGVCSDKSFLADLLLKNLGFGTALFVYEAENHMAVAIQCSEKNSTYGSGYCYAETTAIGSRIGMIPVLDAQNNQAQVRKMDYFSSSQSQFDTKNIGEAAIYEKTSGETYAGINKTLQISQQIDALGSWLAEERQALKNASAQISADQAALKDLENKMNKYSKNGKVEQYNDLVPDYNDLLDKLKKEIKTYNSAIEAYNQKVNSYNGLLASFQ